MKHEHMDLKLGFTVLIIITVIMIGYAINTRDRMLGSETITVPTHLGIIYPEDVHNEYMLAQIRPGGAFVPWRCEEMVKAFGPPVYATPSVVKADLEAEARGTGSSKLRVSLCLANVVVEVFE